MVDGSAENNVDAPRPAGDPSPEPARTPPPAADPPRVGRSTQFWITTAVGIAGVLVAAAGVVAAWPRGSDPPAPAASIEMDHADFAALSYERQLDLCVPYVRENFDRANQRWRLREDSRPGPVPASAIDDVGATGQQIMDMNRTIYDMAKLAPRLSTAQNLMSCVYADVLGDPGASTAGEHGDQRPLKRFPVEGESATYTRGSFAGFAQREGRAGCSRSVPDSRPGTRSGSTGSRR